MQIELLKPHTHAGKPLASGARLELPESSARWLIEQGVAQALSRPVPPQPAAREAAAAAANPLPSPLPGA